jgi:20S proteasome alpha/beta subunit
MRSTDTVGFEPPQTKIKPLTDSIVLMGAGDENTIGELLRRVSAVLQTRSRMDGSSEWRVDEVADLWSRELIDLRLKGVETNVLAPYGLTMIEFYTRQHHMQSDFLDRLTLKIQQYELPVTQAIIAGIDATGPHIYQMDPYGNADCADRLNYATIGSGAELASGELQRTLDARTTYWSFSDAALATYMAKRRAEIAPTVGKVTDMLAIVPASDIHVPQLTWLKQDGELKELGRIYDRLAKLEKKAYEQAEKSAEQYVQKLIEESTAKLDVQVAGELNDLTETP